MAKISILYCERIKDFSCIACAKCYKGIQERNGEFSRHDTIGIPRLPPAPMAALSTSNSLRAKSS